MGGTKDKIMSRFKRSTTKGDIKSTRVKYVHGEKKPRKLKLRNNLKTKQIFN